MTQGFIYTLKTTHGLGSDLVIQTDNPLRGIIVSIDILRPDLLPSPLHML